MIEGGRNKPDLGRPGKTSDGVANNIAKPKLKKFGESPGPENISRDTWKWRSPICM
jgi:hypothetical protein